MLRGNLGFIYLKGSGVEVDLPQAIKWFTGAALKGCVDSQYNLGFIHCELLRKSQSPHNFRLGSFWYNEAATAGHTLAQYNLGLIYMNGFGVERDKQEALKWFLSAAEKGHEFAQYNLGTFYMNGLGVEKDEQQAQKWFLSAAEKGYERARRNLEMLWVNEGGIQKNEKEANKHIWMAIKQGYMGKDFEVENQKNSTHHRKRIFASVKGEESLSNQSEKKIVFEK